MKVQSDSTVTMAFRIRLKDGTIAEDSKNYGQDFTFQMGTGVFPDKLESEMLDLEEGSEKKIMLLPEEGFGEPHPANIYRFPTNKFPEDMDLEQGMVVAFQQPNGAEMPGVIKEFENDEVSVDFNHPLSGQVVLFEVTIKQIEVSETPG